MRSPRLTARRSPRVCWCCCQRCTSGGVGRHRVGGSPAPSLPAGERDVGPEPHAGRGVVRVQRGHDEPETAGASQGHAALVRHWRSSGGGGGEHALRWPPSCAGCPAVVQWLRQLHPPCTAPCPCSRCHRLNLHCLRKPRSTVGAPTRCACRGVTAGQGRQAASECSRDQATMQGRAQHTPPLVSPARPLRLWQPQWPPP